MTAIEIMTRHMVVIIRGRTSSIALARDITHGIIETIVTTVMIRIVRERARDQSGGLRMPGLLIVQTSGLSLCRAVISQPILPTTQDQCVFSRESPITRVGLALGFEGLGIQGSLS